MAGLKDLIGDVFISRSGEETSLSDILASESEDAKRVVGIYFSAHWCPPCRAFTPRLAEFYEAFRASTGDKEGAAKLLEIIFVSSDSDQNSFDEYIKDMPWKAIPYSDKDLRGKLSKLFKVRGIPTLVFLDADTGKLICSNGTECVMENPEGEGFPWPAKSLAELMVGELLKGEDKVDCVEALSGKVTGFYFSGHWCPPCRAFTPELIESYEKIKSDGKAFEIVFISSDRTVDAFKEYYESMPWLALPYKDPRSAQLSRLFEVSGIPMLVLVDENYQVITTNGRMVLGRDKEGLNFPWPPKPYEELDEDSVSCLNDNVALILFTKGDESLISSVNDLLEETSKNYLQEQKASTESSSPLPRLSFLYEGSESADVADSIRSFAKMEGDSAKLVILDIQEQRIFVSPEDVITKDVIHQLVDEFKSEKINFTPISS